MFRRWSKRLVWLVMLSLLSLLPSQVAHVPRLAWPDEAALDTSMPSVSGFIGLGLGVAGGMSLLILRLRRPRPS